MNGKDRDIRHSFVKSGEHAFAAEHDEPLSPVGRKPGQALGQQNSVVLEAANGTSGKTGNLTVLATGTTGNTSAVSMNADQVQINTTSNGTVLFGSGEVFIPPVGGDGTGKIVCIKSDTSLGTCNASSITTSGCTCS